LRDGSHAMRHKFEKSQIEAYAKAAEEAKIPSITVGHGNGLGASSIQIGKSLVNDYDFVKTAYDQLSNTELAVFLIPGFGTVRDDVMPVLDMIDTIFAASHCSETDTTQSHIEFAVKNGKKAWGVMMMTHMLQPDELLVHAKKMQSYGANGILLMDSAGTLLNEDVKARISTLSNSLDIDVGFHAHNNLGLAVSNSLTAFESGAKMIDCTMRGFGAGAGNCPLEVLAAALQKQGYCTGMDLYKVMDISQDIVAPMMKKPQEISRTSLASGLAGVFSGFCPLAEKAAERFHVDSRDILMELGKRKIVAGQEDYIIQIASELAQKKNSKGES